MSSASPEGSEIRVISSHEAIRRRTAMYLGPNDGRRVCRLVDHMVRSALFLSQWHQIGKIHIDLTEGILAPRFASDLTGLPPCEGKDAKSTDTLQRLLLHSGDFGLTITSALSKTADIICATGRRQYVTRFMDGQIQFLLEGQTARRMPGLYGEFILDESFFSEHETANSPDLRSLVGDTCYRHMMGDHIECFYPIRDLCNVDIAVTFRDGSREYVELAHVGHELRNKGEMVEKFRRWDFGKGV